MAPSTPIDGASLAVTGANVVALLIAASSLIGVGALILAGAATSRRTRIRTQ